MIKYFMTSDRLDGEIEFTFSDEGNLECIKFDGSVKADQYRYILRREPFNLERMELLMNDASGFASFVKEVKELTFIDFWNKYNEKELSSKKTAEIRWNNMSKSNRIKAYNYIARYKASIPQGVRLKYAETYLNSELWNNKKA